MCNDQEIVDRLKQETDEIVDLKTDIWKNIEQQLPNNVTSLKKKRKKKRFMTIALMAAAITIVWAVLSTPTGLALIQKVKDMFIPHKTIELDIEGQQENADVDLETNEALRYGIYVDTSRYEMIEGSTSDKIVPSEPIGDEYPEVFMEITQEETTTEAAIADIKSEIETLDMDITAEEETTTPIKASFISTIGKGEQNEAGDSVTQGDTPVHQYFITEEQSGHVFIIKQVYFLEAAEGHGARFDAMLETFETVE